MKHLFLSLLLLGSPLSFAGTFIGNPGDGIEINGRLFVLDLVLSNLQQDPFVGDLSDPQLPSLKLQQLNAPIMQEILLRKLTDLNHASSGVGDLLATAVNAYDWILVSDELSEIPDFRYPIELPKNSRLFRLANRLGSTIRINQTAWNRLDDTNKAALILHEAVYGLVKPLRSADGGYSQSARVAQQITGSFFSVSFFQKPSRILYDDLAANLLIPPQAISSLVLRQPTVLSAQILQAIPSEKIGALPEKAAVFSLRVTDQKSALNNELFVETICQKWSEVTDGNPAPEFFLELHVTPRAIKTEFRAYRTTGDLNETQKLFSIQPMHFSQDDRLFYSDGLRNCPKALLRHLQAIEVFF